MHATVSSLDTNSPILASARRLIKKFSALFACIKCTAADTSGRQEEPSQ
jgi:hypothetical protein